MLVPLGMTQSECYLSKEYVPLILYGEELGHGATGNVYRARFGPSTALPPGKKDIPLIVKLATSGGKLFRLRHEYDIYTHLNAVGVKGVPHILGYYQDFDHEAGALIMEDAGTPLARRTTARGNVPLTDPERYAITCASPLM